LDIPNVIFDLGTYTDEQQREFDNYDISKGYSALNIPEEIQANFTISAQGKSAYASLEDLLFNNTYCADSINISSIPIYYL